MNALQRPVVVPQVEIAVHRALRRQVFRDGPPLATRAQDIQQAVHDLADVHRTLVAAALRRWNLGLNQRPLGIGQVARISKLAPIIASTVLGRPHPSPQAGSPPFNHNKLIRFNMFMDRHLALLSAQTSRSPQRVPARVRHLGAVVRGATEPRAALARACGAADHGHLSRCAGSGGTRLCREDVAMNVVIGLLCLYFSPLVLLVAAITGLWIKPLRLTIRRRGNKRRCRDAPPGC